MPTIPDSFFTFLFELLVNSIILFIIGIICYFIFKKITKIFSLGFLLNSVIMICFIFIVGFFFLKLNPIYIYSLSPGFGADRDKFYTDMPHCIGIKLGVKSRRLIPDGGRQGICIGRLVGGKPIDKLHAN